MAEAVQFDETTVVQATEAALREAKHLTRADAAAVAALRVLAAKLDAIADTKAGVTETGQITADRHKGGLDNVTAPTFLKYCDALGLTPAGRRAMASGSPAKQRGKSGGTLSALRGGLAKPA